MRVLRYGLGLWPRPFRPQRMRVAYPGLSAWATKPGPFGPGRERRSAAEEVRKAAPKVGPSASLGMTALQAVLIADRSAGVRRAAPRVGPSTSVGMTALRAALRPWMAAGSLLASAGANQIDAVAVPKGR